MSTGTDPSTTARPETPAEAWHELRRGNARFVSGEPRHPRQDVERRTEVASGQAPLAALLGCSDSRLAAEIIFDQGLGDLFVVRNAGQVASESAIGSLDYAVGALGVPLIVVLAHDNCGAVRAAIDAHRPDAAPLSPHIRSLIDHITPAVQRVIGTDGTVDAAEIEPADVGQEHLRDTVTEILEASEMISAAIAEGKLAIVGANYRLSEGRAETDVVVGAV
ncbi:carbonic anhydrase [Rathayibacter sp. YIM 133350]|uniref:carbonic anhydrase n=1 Tax=Rathayibacter sp. YIM 133350 TaxID=3131992 RepID=UPI00307F3AA2